jgi:dUTP pyrophosphatase
MAEGWESVKIKLLNEKCRPYRAHDTDSGLDLRANIDRPVIILPHQVVLIPTGVAVELPEGYEGQIRPRSGLSKQGVLAAYGTIDSGYRGEIGVVLVNMSDLRPYKIEPYERIAQLVVAPVHIPEIEFVEELGGTERGAGGFGSTGRS